MSPGGTMMRVYDALKARILNGDCRPGERLDPARLAPEFGASPTPVRDALHRLSGEGLIDSFQHEGFRVVQISEAVMRDRYEWSAELLGLVARAGFRHGVRPVDREPPGSDYRSAVADAFQAIALLSPNHEHRFAVAALIDRSALFRLAEAALLPHAMDDVARLWSAIRVNDSAALRQALDHFHRFRIRQVPMLAARLREYPLRGG